MKLYVIMDITKEDRAYFDLQTALLGAYKFKLKLNRRYMSADLAHDHINYQYYEIVYTETCDQNETRRFVIRKRRRKHRAGFLFCPSA